MTDLENSMCIRKARMTEAEARAHAERNPGTEVYPCPYSPGRTHHWHVATHPAKGAVSPRWWAKVDADARRRGGLGWPDGYAVAQLRAAWARRKDTKAAGRS